MTSSKTSTQERSLAKVIIPLITLGLLAIFWRYNLKWMTIPVIVFLLFYYAVLPKLVRAQVDRFHRRAIQLLTTGKAAEVPRLVKRSILLQLFAPSAPIDAKLGLAYAQCEAFDLAVTCFDSAIPSAPPAEQPALQSGLVKALLVTNDLARAEAEGSALLYKVTRLPELLAIVARARVGLGKTDDETRKLLEEADSLARTADESLMVALTRIELALAAGRKPDELPEKADSDQRLLRAWVHLVRGKLRHKKGDLDKAERSFAKAVETLPSSFVSAAAEHYLDDMKDNDDRDNENGVGAQRAAPPQEKAGAAPSPKSKRKRKRRR